MILTELPAGTTLFRAHTPRWASRPISGSGAAAQGGRFNRAGVEALYLSMDEVTALREYQRTSLFLPPCTLCSYTVALQHLVDLRQLHDGAPWDDLWHDWREDWRHLRFELHIEPPTWVLADMVLASGYTGIVFPSQVVADGTNVVVYPERLSGGNSLTVNDPDGCLPRDMSSWAGQPPRLPQAPSHQSAPATTAPPAPRVGRGGVPGPSATGRRR